MTASSQEGESGGGVGLDEKRRAWERGRKGKGAEGGAKGFGDGDVEKAPRTNQADAYREAACVHEDGGIGGAEGVEDASDRVEHAGAAVGGYEDGRRRRRV